MQVALRWTSGIPFLGLDVVIAPPRQRSPQCATSGFTCCFEAAGPTAAITVSVYEDWPAGGACPILRCPGHPAAPLVAGGQRS